MKSQTMASFMHAVFHLLLPPHVSLPTFGFVQAGLDPKPEIMVPVVSTAKELRLIVPRIEAAVADELKKAGVDVSSKHACWL